MSVRQVNKTKKEGGTTQQQNDEAKVVPKQQQSTTTPSKKPKGIISDCVNGAGFGSFVTNMPLYIVASSSKKGDIALGGGGGESKTGIPNGLVILKWNSKTGGLSTTGVYDTDTIAVMNLDLHPTENVIIHGANEKAILLRYIGGAFEKIGSITTVAPGVEKHYQKIVRFNAIGDRILTCNTDGSVRLWSYPALRLLATAQDHKNEIDDADFSTDGTMFATSSKDNTCKILTAGTTIRCLHTLTYTIEGRPAAFRGSRFNSTSKILYTAQSPRGKPTYITAWDTKTGVNLRSRRVHDEHHTCFGLSKNDEWCAIGTAEKVVVVVRTDTLQPVMKIQDHGFIVTNVTFSPDNDYVISTGADHVCKYRKIEPKTPADMKLVVFMISVFILLLTIIISALK